MQHEEPMFIGQYDVALSDEGRAQAAEAAMTQTTAAQKVAANTQAIASDQAAGAATVAKATTDVAANTASAASSAGASAAKLPFPANLLAVAAAISAVLGLMAAIPKFAGGGVVQGGSSINDLQLARVNAGEMILNGSQQKRLWNAINPLGQFIQQFKRIAIPDSNDLFFVTVAATTFVKNVIILIFSQHRLHKIFDII